MLHKLRKQFREHRSQVGLDRQEKVFSSLPDREPLQNLEGHEVIDLGV